MRDRMEDRDLLEMFNNIDNTETIQEVVGLIAVRGDGN
jgi:hypothetical protein